MIYTINEARNVEEYRAEKAAREKAEKDKKDKQFRDRYNNKGIWRITTKTRADGHEDRYQGIHVGSRNRKVALDDGSTKIHMYDDEDRWRDLHADDVTRRNIKCNNKARRDRHEINDAVNRNMRRHPERWDGSKPVKPKSESTIFDNIEIV
jgi:hypothetical protein